MLKDVLREGFFLSQSLSVLFAASLKKRSLGASSQGLKYHCLVPIDKKNYQPIAHLKLRCERNRGRLVCIKPLLLTPGARGSKVQRARAGYSSPLHSDSLRMLQSFGVAFTTRSGHLPTFSMAQQLVPSFCQPQSSTY